MFIKFFFLLIFTSQLLMSQDFTGIRIYINPGHGGYDSDDRFIPATGFWESEGNLTKGLFLRSILDSLNATTAISRTTNTTADDLPLSVISADANNFDADFFHSIHSNGFQGTANYTVMLYKEINGAPEFQDAKEMCDIMANTIFQTNRTTNKYTRGDQSFLGFNLGVLRNLTMPGTLSEGSFHDYIPESWRLKNEAYLKHEAWAIAKAFVDYFDLSPLQLGQVAGILRDPYDNVDYFSFSNDRKKPLNYVRAILLPDSIVYEGDDFNNGFYMFDRITPGEYDIILEAENYERDTVTSISVVANRTTFVDRNLEPKPDFSTPTITEYSPSETENVRLNSDIVLDFSVKMDRVSVEQSFTISPNAIGIFKWESNDRRMIFSPDDYLDPGTSYQITLNTFAKSAFDVFIDQPFTHTFTTRSSLSLLSTYPDQDSEGISTTVKIILKFDAPLNENTLGGNIYLEDLDGNNVNPAIEETDYENGRIIFEPAENLENNKFYQVRLGGGIEDLEGSNFNTDTLIVFKTEVEETVDGTAINDFEEIGSWWQPEESGSTSGIDPDNTSFIISPNKSIDGTNSGRLRFEFTEDSLGVCRVYNQQEPSTGVSPDGKFGMWVFGDLSYNLLDYWFRDNSGTNIPLFVDTLNWTGWKFKHVDLTGYGELSFHSIVIKQNKFGDMDGELYFDSILGDVLVDIEILESELIPNEIELFQNYPNPFNPATNIQYSIPAELKIKKAKGKSEKGNELITGGVDGYGVLLKVYDILGREIATLVDRKQAPGNYEVTWNAVENPSGIYFYVLNVEKEIVKTRKMILLK